MRTGAEAMMRAHRREECDQRAAPGSVFERHDHQTRHVVRHGALLLGALVLLGLSGVAEGKAAAVSMPNECVPELRLSRGWCGDGGRATLALAIEPRSLAVMPDGSFAFSDLGSGAIRRVRGGVINRVAGRGAPGDRGAGRPALRAGISQGTDLAAATDGSLLIVDSAQHWVRRVSPDGAITTVAGTGFPGFAGDGGPAIGAQLLQPSAVAALPDGGFLIADLGNRRVRRVSADGIITTVAGNGGEGFSGDGGAATQALLSLPADVAPLPDGGLVILDISRGTPATAGPTIERLRRVSPGGVITTVFVTEDRIRDVAPDSGGALIAMMSRSSGRGRVLRLALDDTATTVFRGRACPEPNSSVSPGDGGPAEAAYFAPNGIAAAPDGGVLIADFLFGRVRRVSPAGVISTVAGGGGVRGQVPSGRCSPSSAPACGGTRAGTAGAVQMAICVTGDLQRWILRIKRVKPAAGRAADLTFSTTLDMDDVTVLVKRGSRTLHSYAVGDVEAGNHNVSLKQLGRGHLTIILTGQWHGIPGQASKPYHVL